MKRLAILTVLLALTLTAAPSRAQVPELMSYQGVLTDNLGNLVPDGNYDITFRIFNVAAAGAALYTETQLGVPVSKGGFSALLNVSTLVPPAGRNAFDQQYWLEIQVAPDATPVSPRVRLASSPFALSLQLPFAQEIVNAGPAVDIKNSGAGAAIRADSRLDVGSGVGSDGLLNYFRAGNATRVLRVFDHGDQGGAINGYIQDGTATTFRLEPDVDGDGGFVQIDGALGTVIIDGTAAGVGSGPQVSISGTRSSVFNTNATTGNAAVVLPNDAIQDVEIFDEPGIASVNSNALINLDATIQTLLSRTITVPAPGFVVVTATSQINLNHTVGTTSQVTAGISTTAGVFPATQDVSIGVPSAAATGFYFIPGATTAAFSVPAGATTFFYLAREDVGVASVNDPTMTLTYSPTAYGVVTAPGPQEATTGGLQKASRPSLDASAIAAEQREAGSFNAARLERELNLVRAELDRIKQNLAASNGAQANLAKPEK